MLGKWNITNNWVIFNFEKDLSADAMATRAVKNNSFTMTTWGYISKTLFQTEFYYIKS